MSPEQHRIIVKARECIKDLRESLDTVMYYTSPQMPESEFKRVREAYDAICHANDLLP